MLTALQENRFWAKVAAGPNGCIVWTGAKSFNGYGVLTVAQESWRAHRLAYVLGYGQPVPDGLQVDHLCGRRDCVNYLHLEAVTQQENLRRARKELTHCPVGHSYAEPGSRYTHGGKRKCAVCVRQRVARYRAAKRKTA